MADKRTAALDTLEVAIAYDEGIIVIDTLDFYLAGLEQRKQLLKTVLTYFAGQGVNFVIGNLNLKRVVTTSNSVRDVLLLDGSGNVKVRDITALISGTNAINTELVKVNNQATESIIGSASSQRQINEQNVGKFNSIDEAIENITNVAATGTMIADPVPQQVTLLQTVSNFSALFPSTDDNVFEIDGVNNKVIFKANGIYQNSVFVQIGNDSVGNSYDITFRTRNVITQAIVHEVKATIEPEGYTGTWINRYEITNAPVEYEYTTQGTHATNLTIENAQISISSVNIIGIPETANPYFIDIFGESDPSQDVPNVQSALSTAMPGYIIRLYGTFIFDSNIDVYDHERLTIDCKGAFLNWTTSAATFTAFDVKNSVNIQFINLFGNITHTGTGTTFNLFDITTDLTNNTNIHFDNIEVKIISGTITNYNIIIDDSAVNSHIINISGVKGVLTINDGIVENVNLSDATSKIVVESYCNIIKCEVGTIQATGTNNIITNNKATTFTLDQLTNIFINNIGQTTIYINRPIVVNGTVTSNAGITTTTLTTTGNINCNSYIYAATKVLISTATSDYKFQIQSGSAYIVDGAYILGGDGSGLLETTNNPFIYRITGGNLGFSTGGVNVMTLDSSGNLKISPGYIESSNLPQKIHYLQISSTGTIVNQYGTLTGVSCTRTGTGVYEISFDTLTGYTVIPFAIGGNSSGYTNTSLGSVTTSLVTVTTFSNIADTGINTVINVLIIAIPT